MLPGEDLRVPGDGLDRGGVLSGVGPRILAVGKGDPGEGVEVGFEGVEGLPFLDGEVVE